MKKGVHPALQWISLVSPTGRLTQVLVTKVSNKSKIFHLKAKRQMAETAGQIAKFKARYGDSTQDKADQ